MKKYLLGIDNGGTYSKAALFDLEGNQISRKSIQIPVCSPKEGYTQRKLEDIKNANFKIIAEIVRECDGDIVGVGVTGHGKGLYLLDKNKEYLYDGIGSTDRRALAYEIEWEKNGVSERIYHKTTQKVMACQPVALLRWLKDRNREIYDRIGSILSMKDFVRYCLTGEIYAEYTDISGTNLLNLRTKKYDRELLREFGIQEIYTCLPEIKKSGEIAGCISKDTAAVTGLREGTPVAAGMFDIDACALAMGNVKNMDMCVIAGTWGINEYVSDKMIDDRTVSMNSIFCNPQYYLAEESSAVSAGNLEWFVKLLGFNDYNKINAMVQSVRPEECNLYYMPFLYASNENPLAKGMLVGLDGYYTDAHIFRAIYEGVVYAHLTHIMTLLKSRPSPEVIRLGGGVVNSEVWSQMFADILQIPIQLIRDVELGTKGAAMAAGVAAGIYSDYDAAVSRCVAEGSILHPNKELAGIYRRKYDNYRRIISSMDGTWETLKIAL